MSLVIGLAVAGTAGSTTGEQNTSSGALLTHANQLELPTIRYINKLRGEHGLQPLSVSRALARAAQAHSVSMARKGYFSHTSANGTVFWKRIARWYGRKNYHRWTVGENLLWSSPTVSPRQAVEMWLDSPSHRRVLLHPDWTQVGLAAVKVTQGPGIYDGLDVVIMTADFGTRS